MAGCILAASLMVMAFPLRWATVQPQRLEPGGGGSKGTPAPQRTVSGLLLAAMSSGDVLLSCPQAVQSKLLPELEAAGSRQAYRAATFGGFGAAVRAALPWGAAAEHSGDMQRMTTV